MRYPGKLEKYASQKGIMADEKGQNELSLTAAFNGEMCETIMKFFKKLTSAYSVSGAP